jgi:hypothetical protein
MIQELILGSKKDIEDARHLETVFKDKIYRKLLENYRKRLRNEKY